MSLLWFGHPAHGAATLNPKILNNIHLGPDPAILPFNQRAQDEPHLARSFSDPTLLIATWKSGGYGDGIGTLGIEYAVSRDGGVTWQRAFVPGIAQSIDAGPFERASDPVGAITFDNVILQSSLGFNLNPTAPPSWVTVSKMVREDAGLGAPTAAVVDQWPVDFVDKNWIAVNSFPGSSTYRQWAIAATTFILDENYQETINNTVSLVSRSNDGGQSWSEHPQFAPASAMGMQPVYLPDGNLVVGMNIRRIDGLRENMAVVISEDGGQTFGSPIYVARNLPLTVVPGIRTGVPLHSLTTDRLRGILYMTWQQRSSAGQSLIQFSRSIDGGRTWLSPINVRNSTSGDAFNPTVAASPDGQHVSILFYDGRDQAGFTNNVYLAESFDGGENWEPNLLVSSETSDFSNGPTTPRGYFYGDYHGLTPALDFDTPGVAVWIDGRNGDPDPYVAQIARTQGTTYEAWKRLRFNSLQLTDPAFSGEGGDPEGDGIPNGIEYILGLEPDEVDTAPFVIKGFTSPDTIEMTYTALPVVTDKEIVWEKSGDLANWEPITPTSVTSVRAAEAAFQNYTVQFASTGEDILFLRMGAREVTE